MCPRTDPSLRSAGIFALYQGFSAGVLDWNGTGGIAVSNSATNAIPVNVSCDPTLTPGALAETETTAIRTQVDDLPLLPNGHDAKRARQYDSAAIRFDPILTYKHYLNVCHLPDNDIDLSDFARYGGRHEMGHAMGFAHVSSSTELMNAFQQCSLSLASINAKYGTALANYNGSTGRVAIRTDNLPH
jgi:hypothetical protein